jgi:hypothetical protein
MDQKVYHSIIDSLLYLCAYMPDIMISACMCARFQAAPKECHMRAVKRIMRYLVLAPNLGLWYPKGSHFDLIGYFDADYVGCKVDRKSTSGACQFLGNCCAQLLWMQQTLKGYGYTMNQVPLLCDNESAIKIIYNPYEHSRTKHINIRHHFLRDHAIKGDIVISHVRTNE